MKKPPIYYAAVLLPIEIEEDERHYDQEDKVYEWLQKSPTRFDNIFRFEADEEGKYGLDHIITLHGDFRRTEEELKKINEGESK